MSAPNPVFVVGMDRSGTTLMSALLNAHPALAIAPETWFVNHWAAPRAGLDLADPQNFENFWREYTSHDFFGLLGLDAGELRARILRLQPRTFAEIFSTILEQYAARFGKRRVGEKTPHHYQHLRTIFEWFPDSRVVFMLRDPRAVYASFRRTPYGHEYPDLHAGEWRAMAGTLEQWRGDRRVMVVRYEDVVTRPKEKLAQICEFIGELFDHSMIERADNERRLGGFGGWLLQNERRALAPIDPSSIDRWRAELSSYHVAVIEHWAGAEMERLGYARSQPRLSVAGMSRMHLGRARRHLRSFAAAAAGSARR